jgi:hypothetical protein
VSDNTNENAFGDDPAEDDGVLEPSDSLDDDLQADVLDTGIDAGEGYRGATRFGVTAEEEGRGESLDQLLAEEEPDAADDDTWSDEEQPSDDDREPLARAGRLVAPDQGASGDDEADSFALDVGVDGAGASAEEAAVHLTDDPPYE